MSEATPTTAFVHAEVDGTSGWTVRVGADRVLQAGPDVRPRAGDEVVDAAGGALLPGLHDHHLHLRGLAAALASVACGPPEVTDAPGLRAALRATTPRDGWVRGVGYHASVAGELDRTALDRMRDDVAVRIQDRSGTVWHLNSRAAEAVGLDRADHRGIVRDATGVATGRLVRGDAWLAERTPPAAGSLADVGRLLARRGVTGVTDATVTNAPPAVADLRAAQVAGDLPQRLHVLGVPGLDPAALRGPRLTIGPVKIVLDEHDLPSLEALVADVRAAHGAGRGVAVHAVTRATLALTVAAFDAAGGHSDDRIEHASVCPPDLADRIADLGACVVTQPNFVAERGDRYRIEVEAEDRPWLYPTGLLVERGVRLAAGTDAPFGRADPWAAIAAAADRVAADGRPLAAEHALPAARALALFLAPLDDPGVTPRRVEAGAPADLCLLDRPIASALSQPTVQHVRLTVVGGQHVDGSAARPDPGRPRQP